VRTATPQFFLGNGDFYSCKIDTQSVAGEFLLGMLTVIMALIHTAFDIEVVIDKARGTPKKALLIMQTIGIVHVSRNNVNHYVYYYYYGGLLVFHHPLSLSFQT